LSLVLGLTRPVSRVDLLRNLRELKSVPLDDLVDRRYEKYRKIGVFVESIAAAELPEEAQLNGKAETTV